MTDILRTVVDGNEHGLHVFVRRLDNGGDIGWWAYHHAFVRFADGKVHRAELAEHTAERAGAVYADGFRSFEHDLWLSGKWKATLSQLERNTGLELALDPAAVDVCSGLVEDGPEQTIHACGLSIVVRRTSSGCRLDAGRWKAKL